MTGFRDQMTRFTARAGLAGVLFLALAACSRPPPRHPVLTPAQALDVAREVLGPEEARASLEVIRKGPAWIVTTARRPTGNGTIQTVVIIDSETGKATSSGYQTMVIDEDL